MTGESAELEMVNIRVRRRAGAAPDMHPWPAGPRFRSSKGVLEKDLLYPGSACFGFHTVSPIGPMDGVRRVSGGDFIAYIGPCTPPPPLAPYPHRPRRV